MSLFRQLRGWAPLVLVSIALGAGCASSLTDGDRHFLAGDFARAEAAYLEYLTGGSAVGDPAARARLHLGLIYSLLDPEFHDPESSDRFLEALIESRPGSAWAQQATLMLSLRQARDRLASELAAQLERADYLLQKSNRLQLEIQEAAEAREEQLAESERLTTALARLEQSIGQLTQQLAESERELEEIKRIDLQTPP